ncbi:hypothetical protein QQX98_007280 [Neonectria punicea]|uniref:Uncharacterized protein n=1 Tax=Neonectria punicea TaxID=979145 RepID=A0ABR1GYF9_9HYPO
MFNHGIDMNSDQNGIGDQFQSSYPDLDAMPTDSSSSFDDFLSVRASASNVGLVVPGDSEATAEFINAHMWPGPETTSTEPESLLESTIDPTLLANSPMETESEEEHWPEERPPAEQARLGSSEDIDLIPAGLRIALKDNALEFRGFITSKRQGAALRSVYNGLGAKPLGETSSSRPETDPTFPQNDEEYRGRIRQMFDTICDWSDCRDWRARMSRKDVVAWLTEMSRMRHPNDQDADLSKVCDADMIPPPDRMPSLLEQWKNVTGREVSTIEIELLCAEVLFNKMLIHSAMRSSWVARITNAPKAENKRKQNNKTGNDRKRKAASQGGSGARRARAEPEE